MSKHSEERREIRKYLLGDLDEGRREQVELRLLSDAGFAEEVSDARQDLFEEYVMGTLSGAERGSFERHCLTAHDAGEKLHFTRALQRYVESELNARATEPITPREHWQRFRQFLTGHRLRVAIPLAAMLLLVAVYASWRVAEWSRPPAQAPQQAAERALLGREIVSLNLPARDDASAQVRSPNFGVAHRVTVRRDISRETQGLPRIALPSGADLLELSLVLEGETYPSYRALLLTDEEAEVAAVGGLRAVDAAGEKVLVFNLPARTLPHGDYQLKVEGVGSDGRLQTVGRYPFRVRGE